MTENELQERCDAAVKRGDLEAAFKVCDSFIAADPNSPIGFWKRAALYARKESFNKAVSDVSEAIRLNPNEASYYFFSGWWKFETGDFIGTESDQSIAISLESEQGLSFVSGSAYFFRALARLKLGKFEETILDAKHVPDDFLIYLHSEGKVTIREIVKAAEGKP